MRGRLVDRLNLGEQVQVAEGSVPPGPLDRLRHLIRGGVARLHRLQRLGQPLVVMGEQLVHPFVGARGDGPVGRQQPGIGQRQRPGQRAEVIQQGRPVVRRLESDRRGDVREHVIAREHDLRRRVVEHDVAAGVTGSVHRAERPGGEVEVGSVCHPAVGVLPVDDGRDVPWLTVKLVEQLQCAQPAQAFGAEEAGTAAVDHIPDRDQVRSLFLAEEDHAAERLAQLDGEGVVVDVDVGHEEVADVA